MELTNSQKKAVETIDKNVAVNAGAGSGKTRVLVERYIYILDNGRLEKNREIESIVAITFTKKAAAEMKERVRKAVAERINKNDKWKRIYNDLEKSNISTIHSFCSGILRENPVESQLDPGFLLMEDYESQKLLKDVIEEYIKEGIENNSTVYELMRYFTASMIDRASNGIVDTIKGLYLKIRSTGLTFSEVKRRTLDTIDGISVDVSIINEIKEKFEYLMSKAKNNSKLGKLKQDEIWIQFREREYNSIDDKLLDTLEYLAQNIGNMKDEEDTIDKIDNLISEAFKVVEKKKRHIYEALLDMFIEIDKNYTEEKKKRGVLDYEDLQIKVLNLLDNEQIRQKYQEKFRYIMVDEFQDTNELQKNIIYRLCSRDTKLDRQNLFIVGDPKQSIYGFRGADVDVFYDVVRDIEEVSREKAISLKDNFRTVNTIMRFINSIFEKIMGDKYDKLQPNKESPNRVDVEILEGENIETPNGFSPSEYAKKYESELIAKRIKALIEESRYEYKDIAILFRSTTDTAIYEEALREYGIPYYNIGGRGFYKRQEILDIINGLKAVNNKYDALSLVAVLRSPMFGLSDKTIYWLIKHSKGHVLEGLKEDIPNVSEKEKVRMKKAWEILSRLNSIKSIVKVYDLISELVEKTYYIETWMLKFGNKQAMANIYKLMEMARKFSNNENRSLEDFIEYIDNQVLEDFDEGQAQIESEDGNTVKIMTIHKSKGLQFKVVIVPQMSKQFNMSSSYILFDKVKGIGIKHPDNIGKLDERRSPIYKKINKEQREKEMEENKRLLYVAMTRAEERLIIGNQSTKQLRDSFRKLIADYLGDVEFEKINDIDIEKGDFKRIIDIRDVRKQPFNREVFPILKAFDDLQGKTFDRLSITQYMTFKECKRRFYMTYYKRLPIDELLFDEEYELGESLIDPLIKGQIVHEICEKYTKGIDVFQLTREVIKSHHLEPRNEILDNINIYINNYIKHYSEDYDYIFTEKEFYYNVSGKYVYGVIDRINIKGNEAELIDFKTNKVTDSEIIIKKYSPQIQLYTKAFQEIYGIKVKRAGLLMLENGEFIDIDIDNITLEKNLKEIENFIHFVNNNREIEKYERSGNCLYCKFKEICQ